MPAISVPPADITRSGVYTNGTAPRPAVCIDTLNLCTRRGGRSHARSACTPRARTTDILKGEPRHTTGRCGRGRGCGRRESARDKRGEARSSLMAPAGSWRFNRHLDSSTNMRQTTSSATSPTSHPTVAQHQRAAASRPRYTSGQREPSCPFTFAVFAPCADR